MSSISIVPGRAYHIDDSFFSLINDPYLMPNKLNGNYRPNFVLFPDPNIKGMYWAIPMSSQIEKYEKLISQKVAKYGTCDSIVIGKYGPKKSAFLIQNMFPVLDKYITNEHTFKGQTVKIENKLINNILNKAYHCLNMYQKGVNMFFTDIKKIYTVMRNEIH